MSFAVDLGESDAHTRCPGHPVWDRWGFTHRCPRTPVSSHTGGPSCPCASPCRVPCPRLLGPLALTSQESDGIGDKFAAAGF